MKERTYERNDANPHILRNYLDAKSDEIKRIKNDYSTTEIFRYLDNTVVFIEDRHGLYLGVVGEKEIFVHSELETIFLEKPWE